VLKRVNETAAEHGVDIIGLVVSQAHDSYTMYVKSANDNIAKDPLFFACDCVAKSLDGNLSIVSAQELKHIDKPQEEKQQEEKQNEKAKTELKEAETKLEKAETKLEKAKEELEKAKEELEKAENGGDEQDIERAKQGAMTAQDGVTAAQKMVTALTTHVARMLF
jgi:septin family protein